MLTAVAIATPGKVFRETIHEEDEFVITDFCDARGLTVEVAFVLDLHIHAAPLGRDRLVYFLSHGKRSEVITIWTTAGSSRLPHECSRRICG